MGITLATLRCCICHMTSWLCFARAAERVLCTCRTNVECLEGRFDTFGVFGVDFTGDLTLGGA